jgi:hypothetical protein
VVPKKKKEKKKNPYPFLYISKPLQPSMPDSKKKSCQSQDQWLVSAIPATWEVEIGRIKVQGQPGQTVHNIPSPK